MLVLSTATGSVGFGCSDSFMVYQISIPVTDRNSVKWDDSRKASYYDFTAWNEVGKPYEFHLFLPPDSQFASAMATLNPAPDLKGQDTDLWELLKSARARFMMSTPAGTKTIDASDLPAALDRFERECGKIFVQNAHKRLKEPVPLDWIKR